LTLRRRLIAVQVGLVTVGLAAFSVLSYQLYRHSSYQQIDDQLQSVAPLLSQTLRPAGQEYGPPPGGGVSGPPQSASHNLPPGSYAELLTPSGQLLSEPIRVPCYSSASCPEPKLPAHLSAPADRAGRIFTVSSTDGRTSFRVLVRAAGADPNFQPDSQLAGDLVVTAIPLTATTHSLHQLILFDLLVGAGVLLLLSAAGLVIIRRGLHPLERMAGTARAIAGGDLSRRASPADGQGEVGQLGQAFNTMMGEIEGAFAARDATEGRLRQFLADASHELRTPLTSIRGYAELYRMGAASGRDEVDTVMSRIEENAQQMSGLVEELLLLARLDQTRPPEWVPVDLVVLVAEAGHDTAVTVPDRRLRFEAPDPVTVIGDAGHLRQAVTNLLGNAVRHTPAGSPIDVSVTAGGGVAVVRVRDHGPGVPPDGLVHAFDRFWRADQSRTGSGNGLGLAIVAAVAAEHGGQATVANAPDGGAVFDIRLPVPKPAGEIPASSAPALRKL
jgi:two-component system, OmpR family, sensor kinase